MTRRSLNRRGLVTSAIALAAVLVLALGRDGDTRGGETARFVPLVELDEAGRVLRPDGTASQVTAVSLVDENGGELLVARVRGRWRLLGHHLAPANPGLVQELIARLAEARALDATPTNGLDARLAGLDLVEGRARRVRLHGPDVLKPETNGDVLAEIWIGSGGAMRRTDASGEAADEVLLLARDLERYFAPPVTRDPNDLPPLALPFVVPPDWPGFASGLERVFVDRADGSGFELERRVDPELPTGLTAWALRDDPLGEWRDAHPVLSTGYTLFVGRVPVVEAIAPESVPTSVTERPDLRITLVSSQNELVELLVGPERADGSRVVVNMWTQVAFELAPEPARLLTPPTSWLEEPGATIPWDPYLR